MIRIVFGFLLWTSLSQASSALAGQEPTAGPARGVSEVSTRQQVTCAQQTHSWFFGLWSRPKEGDVSCVGPTSAAVPLILGTGY